MIGYTLVGVFLVIILTTVTKILCDLFGTNNGLKIVAYFLSVIIYVGVTIYCLVVGI